MAPVWVGWVLLAPQAGCQQAGAAELVLSPPILDVSTTSPLDQHAALCRRTGGSWSRSLVSCQCGPGSVFQLGRGCAAVALAAPVQLSRGSFAAMAPDGLNAVLGDVWHGEALHVAASVEGLDPEAVQVLADALDRDPGLLLGGLTLPASDADFRHLLYLSRTTAENVEAFWGDERELDYPPRVSVLSTDPLGALRPPQPVEQESCERALATTSVTPEAGRLLCAAAHRVSSGLLQNSRWPMHFTAEGTPCRPSCALVANRLDEQVNVTYTVVMQDYVPWSRLVRLGTGHATELLLFLGARGSLDAAVVYRHNVLSEGDALVRSERTVFGTSWEHLGGRTQLRGERAALEATLAAAPLPGDGLAAVVVDSAIDVRLPGLRGRLNLPETSLGDFAADAAPFGVNGSSVENLLTLLDDDPLEGYHGTRTAAVVAQDLPQVRLSFIRAQDVAHSGDLTALRDGWIERIRSSGASVVNMSVTYSRLVADCEGFFGTLFDALPEVLFVVAAGNSGAHEPQGTCPAGLAVGRPNVLTVAGTDSSDTALHPHSNYGMFTAKVAAPFAGLAPRVGGSQAPISPRLDGMVGTSFSAALVSNAALHLLERYPALQASQLAAALMQSCRPQGLEVACGGSVDFSALQAWVPGAPHDDG